MNRAQLLAIGAGAAVLPLAETRVAVASSSPVFHFDEARFNEILAKPARHRQCCASAKIGGGAVLESMMATMYAYEIQVHEGPGTVHDIGVL